MYPGSSATTSASRVRPLLTTRDVWQHQGSLHPESGENDSLLCQCSMALWQLWGAVWSRRIWSSSRRNLFQLRPQLSDQLEPDSPWCYNNARPRLNASQRQIHSLHSARCRSTAVVGGLANWSVEATLTSWRNVSQLCRRLLPPARPTAMYPQSPIVLLNLRVSGPESRAYKPRGVHLPKASLPR
ncbi:hypothetical protein FA15DRAFT_253000 [Coprinopsis marcescibilis]|uniref:Uncharacterized protein n=1 Tax=Coprinopsis marcescibilis TaxID=230819 RepID=A0A5C3KFE2_COPMA|nr:hypothetical protein FA15DRAFT_253000 [Coprinopsis marcescibilis]